MGLNLTYRGVRQVFNLSNVHPQNGSKITVTSRVCNRDFKKIHEMPIWLTTESKFTFLKKEKEEEQERKGEEERISGGRGKEKEREKKKKEEEEKDNGKVC